jgi:hypothetical protein
MLILKNWLAATKDTSHIIYVVCVVVYLLNTTTYTAYAPPLMITITQAISLYIHIRTWLHCLTFIHKHSHFLMHTNTLMYVQTLMLTPQHNCLLKLNHRILFITISWDRTKWYTLVVLEVKDYVDRQAMRSNSRARAIKHRAVKYAYLSWVTK